MTQPGMEVACHSCGAPNEHGRKFCGECGARLVATCPACASANRPDARFCGECGARLGAAAGGGTAGTPEAPPSPVGTGPAPVAERRLVSVLFADLVGFTTLSEGRDPEAVRELLTRHFESAREVIDRYGGTIEKFIGDAVMAVWGAPVAHEDDAERAVRAALELVEAVPTLAPGLAARAAVVTGEAAVTLGAAGQGMVAGDLVNTASRLQSIGPASGVLVGEATMRATDRSIAYEPAGDQVLKGKESPVPAWRALRVVAEIGGRNRQDGLEPPFVGRDPELRLLKELLAATGRERRVRLVSVTGQAGIGKSRLAWEFSKWVDGIVDSVWWHAGRSPAYGEGVTFWALAEMIRGRCGLTEQDGPSAIREQVAETVRRWVPDPQEARRVEPALLTLLGVEAPPIAREELFAAWRTFFERITLEGTVVLVFEDLQWADAGLLDFIDHVLEWSSAVPIMILTLARPELLEKRPDWGAGRRNFVASHLEPLPPETMRELLLGLVPGLPDAAVRSVVARADGVPLYAVEIVRMLVAEGRLAEVEGAYRPTGDIGELAVPTSLHALIGARLDSLDPIDRQLLQDASVLGQTFTVASLAAVSGIDTETLEGRLRALVRRELLVEENDPRSPERGQFGFVQALIREVAYGTIALADRRARHLAAARYFETLAEDSIAGALAAHYVAAYRSSTDGPERDALAVQARLALRGAADRAVQLGSFDHAVGFLRQALEVTADEAEQAALVQAIGIAASTAGHHQSAIPTLRDALDRFEALGDDQGVVASRGYLGSALLNAREPQAARVVLEPVEAAFRERPDDPAAVRAAAQVPRLLMFLGQDFKRALDVADLVMTAAQRLGLEDVIADTLITKGQLTDDDGRRYEAVALLRAGIDIATRLGIPQTAMRGRINMGTKLPPLEAFEVASQGHAEAARLGLRTDAAIMLGNAGSIAVETGDWEWASQAMATFLESLVEPVDRLNILAGALWIAYLQGRPDAETMRAEMRSMVLARDRPADESTDEVDVRMVAALASGDFLDVVRHADIIARAEPLNREYAYTWAARASALGGHRDALATAAEALDALGPSILTARAAAIQAQAALAAIDGRTTEAVAGYREAIRRWDELGCRVPVALCGLEMAVHIDHSRPEVRAAIDASRDILIQLDAGPWLGMLEAALEGPRSGGRASGSAPATPSPASERGRSAASGTMRATPP